MRIAGKASSESTTFARHLRATQTKAELQLWSKLRRGGLRGKRFKRQQPLGPYVLDFYCHEAKLAIELDGGQHVERVQRLRDSKRAKSIDGRLR